MIDLARSADPVLDRLLVAAGRLHPPGVHLGLERMERLLVRLGSPHRRLPPVFHVAGTNGKGSTVAFLRAALEAAGHRVHAYTSPHLVAVNERVRLAGRLATDEELAEALADVMRVNAGQPVTFFEVLTAAALLLFAATEAEAVLLEVGLGGRLDATNVVPRPAATAIAQLAMDHMEYLGPTLRHIAREKAGIARRGVPLVAQAYPAAVAAEVREVAAMAGAVMLARGEAWGLRAEGERLRVEGDGWGWEGPLPALAGRHQADNAALAVAMLKAQKALAVSDTAIRSGLAWARWPARLQRIDRGLLADTLAPGSELWVDGAHNPAAARALAEWLAAPGPAARDLPPVVVVGMLARKDLRGFLGALPPAARRIVVPVPGHDSAPGPAGVPVAPGLVEALGSLAGAHRVLITGSLHLAGHALALSGWQPD